MMTLNEAVERSVFPYEADSFRDEAVSWVNFIPSLVSRNGTEGAKLSKEYFHSIFSKRTILKEKPYVGCFSIAAENFLSQIHEKHGQKFSAEKWDDIYRELSGEYMNRCVAVSRYALHTLYVGSGLPYSQWLSLFENENKDNPWVSATLQYPMLIRLLANLTKDYTHALDEMLDRFEVDGPSFDEVFREGAPDQISSLQSNLSDPHNHGRMVMRLGFHNGKSIIYKPKSLHIEKSFNDFMRDNEDNFGIKGLKVLARDGYGWVEDIGDPAKDTKGMLVNPEAIGKASACFWLLNATDLHIENVRSMREGIYALDLETLLAAPVPSLQNDLGPRWRHHSVNATALYDGKVGEQKEGLRVGGFDPIPVITSPIPYIEFILKDDKVEISNPDRPAPDADNIPEKASKEQINMIAEGFRSAASETARQKLLEFIEGLDDDCKLRLVPRDTVFYEHVLQRIYQPRFLRDAKAMYDDLHLMHQAIRSDTANAISFHTAVEDEIKQLLNGDIPYFSYHAGSLSLNTSSGKIENFFESTGKKQASIKVKNIEASDIEEQIKLMSVSLGYYKDDLKADGFDIMSQSPSSKITLLGEFNKYAANVMQTAYVAKNFPARWLSMKGDTSATNLQAAVGGNEFFGGYWGIVLALQSVEEVVSDQAFRDNITEFLEREASIWPDMVAIQNEEKYGRKYMGLGFSGIGGELFAHSVLISQNPQRWGFLKGELKNTLSLIKEQIGKDKFLDVIGGSAGLILGTDQILRHLPGPYDSDVCEIQHIAAMHLIDKSVDINGVPAWKVPNETNELLGYAHGWAGFVTALSTAKRNMPEGEDRIKIEDFLIETSHYPEHMLKKHGQWLDMRGSLDTGIPMNDSWCNGIPGLLRGMFEVHSVLPASIQEKMQSDLEHLKNHIGSSDVYRFCCGEMGGIDLLLDLERSAHSSGANLSPSLFAALEEVLSHMNEEDHHHNHIYPERMFNGLFQGKSGMAYTGLRFFLPNLPSLSGQYM